MSPPGQRVPPPGFRLAVVLSHPTQYYSPWFRWIAAHTDINLRVFYLWDFGIRPQPDRQFEATFRWDVDLLSGYAHEFVPNSARDPGTHHFFGLQNPTLKRRIRSWAPDAILMFGYKWASHLGLIASARLAGRPLIFRGDSHLLGRERPRLLPRMVLAPLFAQFDAFLPVGSANRTYFRQFGVPDAKQFFAPHSVDAARFDPEDERVRDAALQLRNRLRIPPAARVVLFAGKFLPAKQPIELLRAFLSLPDNGSVLVLVGGGSLADELRREANGTPRVRFLPFANQSEMPAHYLLANVFALPSRGRFETWGLSVNEAMHMGVPCLVSDRVGCQQDLVTDDETGWVFQAERPASLATTLQRALRAPVVDLDRLRRNVRRRIQGYTYEQATRGLVEALVSVAPRPVGARTGPWLKPGST